MISFIRFVCLNTSIVRKQGFFPDRSRCCWKRFCTYGFNIYLLLMFISNLALHANIIASDKVFLVFLFITYWFWPFLLIQWYSRKSQDFLCFLKNFISYLYVWKQTIPSFRVIPRKNKIFVIMYFETSAFWVHPILMNIDKFSDICSQNLVSSSKIFGIQN